MSNETSKDETHPREAEAQAAFDTWWNSRPPRVDTLSSFMAGYASALLAGSRDETSADVCPQCGGSSPWIPKAGENLTENETGEPCHIEWVQGNAVYVKWDTPACSYGTYNFNQMREGFSRVAVKTSRDETPAALTGRMTQTRQAASDQTAAPRTSLEGQERGLWRVMRHALFAWDAPVGPDESVLVQLLPEFPEKTSVDEDVTRET